MKHLIAYYHGTAAGVLVDWLAKRIAGLHLQPVDEESKGESDETRDEFFRDERHYVRLEHFQDSDWLELTLAVTTDDTAFAGWDDLRLGEALVDELGGQAIVDCGGRYCDPHSDSMVRVTRQALELVQIDGEIGEPIDERWTRHIARRRRP